VSPATVEQIAAVIEATGAPFVDAGIIGPPPGAGGAQPSIYASGQHAARLSVLNSRGLDIRVLDAPIGAASALKMSFAGITKGVIAVATAMALAATRVGATKELREELAAREPALLASLNRKVPDMLPKAYRWVAEMEEISRFLAADAGAEIYVGASHVYERVARAAATEGAELHTLRELFKA
jgi:3-hydroxyisobutyrate dehydrogenase-like beta-hydroxyacid dehydrogenase